MYRTFLSLSLLSCTMALSVQSHAQEQPAKGISTSDSRDDLKHTRQRLDALIKAASEQNLVNIKKANQGNAENNKKNAPLPNREKNAIAQTQQENCDASVFSFPQAAKINTYVQLETLKKRVVSFGDTLDNGEHIDTANFNKLAFAYLGLGFSEEAILASMALNGSQKHAIQAMANTLMDVADADDIHFIRLHADCDNSDNNAAQIWLDLVQAYDEPFTNQQIKAQQDNLAALPSTLQNIFGVRLGLKSLRAGDIEAANTLYATLIKRAPVNADTHDIIMSKDLQFFEAMRMAASESDDDISGQKKAQAIQTLKSFANTDNPYRVQALQMLTTQAQQSDNNQHMSGDIYPGFSQDLDAAAQTYSGHNKGQQVLAQKIAFLAQNQALEPAIALAKDSFEIESAYFQDSVIVISGYLHADLISKNTTVKLWALELLIREAAFFAHNNDIITLNRAGIAACAQLGLPKLAVQLMPMDKWQGLDVQTQILLALGLGQEAGKYNKSSIFQEQIYAQTTFRAGEIERAFARKDPSAAFEILRGTPNDDVLQKIFASAAWTAGYWSLVDNNMRHQSKRIHANKGSKAQSFLTPQARNLAAQLSINAPLLASQNEIYDLDDLTSLQSYLASDLDVFHKYLRSDAVLAADKTTASNQSANQDKQNG